jgi:hypothetical protein
MKNTIILSTVVATIFMSGCANRPESITASHVSYERYIGLDCTQLASAMSSTRAELIAHSDKQDTAANLDAAGVFLVLIPPSALVGDNTANVAKWKGKVEAIETAQIKNKCKVEYQ